MNPSRMVFVDSQLRPFWRFLLSVIVVLFAITIANTVVAMALALLHVRLSLPIDYLVRAATMLVSVLAVFKLMTAALEHKPLASMGLAFYPRWRIDLGHGLALGAAMMLSVGLLDWALGLVHFALSSDRLVSGGFYWLILLAIAATNEAVIFRGYPFQRLVEAISPGGAVALSAVLFGLAHIENPHSTWISTANTMLAGVFLAVAYLRTRALWMPIGAHLTWNFVQAFILGLPVSGPRFEGSILVGRVTGADWLTGGSYGPEGGLLATVAMIAGTIYLLLSKRIYISKGMEALVLGPPSPEGGGRSVDANSVTSADLEKDERG